MQPPSATDHSGSPETRCAWPRTFPTQRKCWWRVALLGIQNFVGPCRTQRAADFSLAQRPCQDTPQRSPLISAPHRPSHTARLQSAPALPRRPQVRKKPRRPAGRQEKSSRRKSRRPRRCPARSALATNIATSRGTRGTVARERFALRTCDRVLPSARCVLVGHKGAGSAGTTTPHYALRTNPFLTT